MKKIVIILEMLAILGVGYFLMKDKIDLTEVNLDNTNYTLYDGMYEYIDVTSEEYDTLWIDLREDGTWKDHNSRMGFYTVSQDTIKLYQNFLGIVTEYMTGSIQNKTLMLGSTVYTLPKPYNAPSLIYNLHNYVYWSDVQYAKAYEVYVDNQKYVTTDKTFVQIVKNSSSYMNVKVRAIDSNNPDKDGAYSEVVTLYSIPIYINSNFIC